jgi:hypothetical protein
MVVMIEVLIESCIQCPHVKGREGCKASIAIASEDRLSKYWAPGPSCVYAKMYGMRRKFDDLQMLSNECISSIHQLAEEFENDTA